MNVGRGFLSYCLPKCNSKYVEKHSHSSISYNLIHKEQNKFFLEINLILQKESSEICAIVRLGVKINPEGMTPFNK